MSTPLTSCNWGLRLELATKLREVSQRPENLLLGPMRLPYLDFFLLKAPTSTFTIKILLRHYMLNRHLNTVLQLGCRSKYHNGWAALRIFAKTNLCVGVPISHLLSVFRHPFSIVSY